VIELLKIRILKKQYYFLMGFFDNKTIGHKQKKKDNFSSKYLLRVKLIKINKKKLSKFK